MEPRGSMFSAPAVQEHDGGPLAHRWTVGRERRAIDVQP
jgi:hypothetical protein